MNFGLERIQNLLEALGRPDERTQIVHVAGTNGKGSVCAYISSVLRTCGYTVGRFNSPHLLEPRDSINVNGQAISQQMYDEAFSYVALLNKTGAIGASSFECLVGAAFYVFDKARLDFVVLEVGLGGLLDATNAIRHPVMTVITAIGMDHAHILGHTIEEIATAKAGIMKSGCPVVIAPQDSETVLKTLVEHAKTTDSPYQLVQPAQFITPVLCKLEFDQLKYTYGIRLCGDYQRMNSATAVTALDWLCRLGLIQMTPEQLAAGMKDTRWPGRLEWITSKENPLIMEKYGLDKILVDGAHNAPATMALRKYIDSLKKEKVIWIIAATAGKDIHDMMDGLIEPNDIVFAVNFTQPAGMPWIQSTEPSEIAKANKSKTVACLGLEEALEKAASACGNEDIVVLCGSLYLVADLYRILPQKN
ncbi:Mur ligase [Mucor mucedo]|uniref:Mur ligase n=1 Tax=Mucor mucedo TaxID=29922 RepID=UPI002220C5BC|nr:Mur ligase [Mucor mucedo]KAI7888476.1 Mur ligase [Mucor mucedo]